MDSVQVHCSRCKTVFSERARRLLNGYSRQCPCCEVVLFFDEDSQNPQIRRAMHNAREARKQLREAEQAMVNSPRRGGASSRLSGGREREPSRTD